MRYKLCGNGPPLLYLPGLDGTGELFYRQRLELAHDFKVVTFSLRSAGDFTYQQLIEDIRLLIAELGGGAVTLCGESFGGTLALSFALTNPELVDRLIVINSFPYFRNRALLAAGRILLEFTPYELVQLGRIAAARLGLLAEDLPPPDREKFIELTTNIPKLAVSRRMSLIADYDLRDRLTEITAPTLFIASQRDRLIDSIAEARFMAARLPNAKVAIIKGMGHVPLPAPQCSLREILIKAGFLAGD